MVKIVYDPDGSLMSEELKDLEEVKIEELSDVKDGSEDAEMQMGAPELGKAKSVQLPLGHQLQGASVEEEKSLVYQFRDRCFS